MLLEFLCIFLSVKGITFNKLKYLCHPGSLTRWNCSIGG